LTTRFGELENVRSPAQHARLFLERE